MLHWLANFFGIDNGAGHGYLFWSASGSDIGELAILGAVIGTYHRHACHQDHCHRIGRHLVDGTPWCNKHHQSARDRITDA